MGDPADGLVLRCSACDNEVLAEFKISARANNLQLQHKLDTSLKHSYYVLSNPVDSFRRFASRNIQ